MVSLTLDALAAPLDRSLLHVFVAGPGYGEGIAVALPHSGWIVLDGCRVSNGRLPILAILDRWKSPAEAVEALLLTHPHADHAFGIRETIEVTGPRRIGVTTSPTSLALVFTTAEATAAAEEQEVVAVVKAALAEGTPAEAICVVARTQGPLRDRFGAALERAGLNVVLLEQEEPRQPGVRLATMHRVKGLEFAIVVMVAIGKHDIPHPTPELRSEDPVMSAQALLRERSLLYVAASRARDELHVFWTGEPSPLVAALAFRPQAMAAPAVVARAPEASLAIPMRAAAPAAPRQARDALDVTAPLVHSALPITTAQQPAVPSPASESTPDAAEPSAPIDELASILSQPISSLAIPTRMKNWAQRSGLVTLGELARQAPGELLAEPNLGRTTVKHTRRFLESVTGRRWEDLRAAPFTHAVTAAPSPRMFANPWDALRVGLTSAQQALLLTTMPMPTRLRSYVEREHLVTLGDLAARTRADLIEAPNLGKSTIDSLPVLVSEYLVDSERARGLVDEGLLECFRTLLEPLDPMLRLVATRRAGLGGDPMTLQELGDEFGVTRERIRQLEVRLCDQLVHQPWTVEAQPRIEAALAAGPVPFAILAGDRWWATASEQPSVVDFIVESVLELDACVIELDEAPWLSRTKATAIAAKLSSLVDAAAKVKLPAPVEVLDSLAIEAAAGLGPHLASYFREELRGRLQLSDTMPTRVLAFGDTRRAELLALLRAAPEPVRVEDLERQLGRRLGKLPDEALHFGQGRIGLRRHFPDFEAWQAVLVPAAVRIVEDQGPDRQWHCTELLDELREHHEIPTWMTSFGLAALAKTAPTLLRYLGRLRVALPGKHDRDGRIFVHDAIERLLQEAGEPVARSVLLERLDQRMGTSDNIGLILGNPPFVRVDLDRIGLLARDVPGGAAAIAEAGAHMEAVLARRGRGLSAFHVREELAQLSPTHGTWSQPLAMSVLRADGRFRLSQNGAVGLSQWDSTRVPTRYELFRSALAEADGRVSVEAVLARIEAYYGERPTRATLGGFAMSAGVGLDGEWITRKKGAEA